MEKIYLVESELVLDYELNRSTKGAFKSKLKAMLEFEAQREAIKKEFADEEGFESEDTDGCYEIYLEGYYAQTHGRVSINEIPLND